MIEPANLFINFDKTFRFEDGKFPRNRYVRLDAIPREIQLRPVADYEVAPTEMTISYRIYEFILEVHGWNIYKEVTHG